MEPARTKTILVLLALLLTASRGSARAQSQSAAVAGASIYSPEYNDSAPAQASHSPLSGTIVDPTGAAIVGANIEIVDEGQLAMSKARSRSDGSFTISPLPPGNYRITVSHSDFETKTVDVVWTATEAPPPMQIVLAIGSVITSVNVQGREDDLLGIADSSTQGTVGTQELEDRPFLRSGEVLETVPGVIITQHAGGGKANQYFLRGFNLDHGTDFAVFIDDVPLNLPSHAHGEGYADMNTVIPEFVRRVNYEKGPYYADVGNYGSAGSAHLELFRVLPQNFVHAEGGMYGFGRLVFGASNKIGQGILTYGAEAYHDDGPWKKPDDYFKYNGLITYNRGTSTNGFTLTARGYHGGWNSSDQIAATAVPIVGMFGAIDPTDGGRSERYSVQGEWQHQNASSLSKITPYLIYYDLNLYSNFTYYLTDPIRGDQFNQNDRRWVAGVDAHRRIFSEWGGHKVENALGFQLRNDWIGNGLYQSFKRTRGDKIDVTTGTILPATTERDNFTDALIGLYGENRIQWMEKFRSVVAMRSDVTHLDVTSLVNAANSGAVTKAIFSPKVSLIFGPWSKTEFYLEGGSSYHSNDARGTTLRTQPVSANFPYPNTPAAPIAPLIPTKGAEVGIRTLALAHLNSTFSIWYLHSKSELQQDGDTGGTTASTQPSDRYGFESSNYWTPTVHWAIDFDIANSKALFGNVDEDDAAPGSVGGRRVPEAIGMVIASGVSLHDLKSFSGSVRLRFFGPRDLTSDSLYRSSATTLINAELGHGIGEKWRVSAEILNLLNRRDHDIDYAYESRITQTATPAFTNVFHPVEPIQARFSIRRSF